MCTHISNNSQDMKIVLVPYAGLCNRMNSLMSAIAFQRETGVLVDIYWERTSDCNAWFDELFEPISSLQIKRLQKYYLKPSNKRNLFLPGLIRKFIFDASFQGETISNDNILLTGKKLGKIYISSCNRFCPIRESEQLSRFLIPLQHIQKRIDTIIQQYNKFTIGVHIRRTDNKAAISNSPIEWFYTKMDEEIQKHPDVSFFLATDDISLKKEITERYGNRIIIANSTLNRKSLAGMEDAVVELWCLASCKKILGSSHSTYSSFASKIYSVPLEINS